MARNMYLDSKTGRTMSPEAATANKSTSMAITPAPTALLKKLKQYGGSIVRASDLSEEDFKKARMQKRHFDGFVYLPVNGE
jgi:hypothetical protein